MYKHGYVQTWVCVRTHGYVPHMVMCPHGYVRGYARMCAWLCPMCGYVCPRVRVLTRSWLCVVMLCLLCYVMLCYVCYVHIHRRNHSVHEYKYFVKPLPSAA